MNLTFTGRLVGDDLKIFLSSLPAAKVVAFEPALYAKANVTSSYISRFCTQFKLDEENLFVFHF